MQIAENTVVTIHYTLTDTKGTVLDSSEGPDSGEPLSYVHGSGMIVPGLEEALAGKSEGDHVKVTIAPEGGYGPREEKLVEKLSRDEFPEGDIEVGMHFRAHGPARRSRADGGGHGRRHRHRGWKPSAGWRHAEFRRQGHRRARGHGQGQGEGHGDHDCTSCHGEPLGDECHGDHDCYQLPRLRPSLPATLRWRRSRQAPHASERQRLEHRTG
jgi:hypothetical protein